MFLDRFYGTKIIFLNEKNIIWIYFQEKITLKSSFYLTPKTPKITSFCWPAFVS